VSDESLRSQSGQITPLLVSLALCLLLFVSVVVDLSGAYLRRQSAASLADGAALAASDAGATAAVYAGDDGYVPIDAGGARAAVDEYLRDADAYAHYPGLRASVQVVGHVVAVQLVMPYDLPVTVPGVRDAIAIRVTASAELPVY
jgi:hypothetical protein